MTCSYFWAEFVGHDGWDMDVLVLNIHSVLFAHSRYLHHIGAPAYQVQAAFPSRERGCCVPW